MNKKINFIYFYGPDGAGKSTQASLLISYLRFHRHKVHRVWIKSHHSFAFLLMKFIEKFGCRAHNNLFFHGFERDFGSKIATIWSFIEFVSVLPWILLRVYIPLLLGYTVVCDRYTIDTVVSIAYTVKDFNFKTTLTARVLLGFIPKKCALFHLDAKTDILLDRRRNEPVTRPFIEFQRSAYFALTKILDTVVIDTSELTVMETSKEVMRHLDNRYY